MRIVIAVLGVIALVSFPAGAAWRVTLKTGEVLVVESYWREGNRTHLVRGGVDVIVDTDRIATMEDGAPEPETALQSATGRPAERGAATGTTGATEAPAAGAAEKKPVASVKLYQERLDEMAMEELEVEEERMTNALLEAQDRRFHAKHGGGSKDEYKALDDEFRRLQRREAAAENTLKRRVAEER